MPDQNDRPDAEALGYPKPLFLNAPLVTPENTSKLLGVTPGTLQVWRSTGRYNLPYVKVGGKVMYRLSSINQFINEQTKQHPGK